MSIIRKSLEEYGLGDILNHVSYVSPPFKYRDDIINLIIKSKGKRILIVFDADPDGYFSGLIMKKMFEYLGFTNFVIHLYDSRSHKLHESAYKEVITGEYELVIIMDTASNEMGKLRDMCEVTSNVILLDHHKTDYSYKDYPSNLLMVNTMIESRDYGQEYPYCSAGIAFTIAYDTLARVGIDGTNIAQYALAGMYADSMNMSHPLSRAIYEIAKESTELLSPIEEFSAGRFDLTKKFFAFKMNNKLNALFRSKKFNILNNTLSGSMITLDDFKAIKVVHEESMLLRETVSDLVDDYIEYINGVGFINISEIFIAGLSEIDKSEFTGVIAQTISVKKDIPVVVACTSSTEEGMYKASFRDYKSRPFLNSFKRIADANGHEPAFGMKIEDLAKFKLQLALLDLKNLSSNRRVNVVEFNEATDDDIFELAIYSEFRTPYQPVYVLQVYSVDIEDPYKYKNNSMERRNYMKFQYKVKDYDIMSRERLEGLLSVYVIPEFDESGEVVLVHYPL